MANKKYVLKKFEGEDAIFVSGDQIVRIPKKELDEEYERLIESGVHVAEIKPGFEISVGSRCDHFWQMDGCVSGFKQNL